MNRNIVRISKYLSYLLRHNPGAIGLTLDEKGWGSIETIINRTKNISLNKELIQIAVQTNDKQRFAISPDGKLIKARHGHTIPVDLDLAPQIPPKILLHGTADRFISSIMKKGLLRQKRNHVHLTESLDVAKAVGSRYGIPTILLIQAEKMHNDGFCFYRTENNVWLVKNVPSKYIERA